MRKASVLLLLLALGSGVALAEKPPRVESVIPADSAMLIMVEDAPEFLASWPESQLGQVWNDPQMKRFFAPLREEMEVDRWEEITHEATGIPLSKILAGLTGQVALVLRDFPDGPEDETESAALIAAVGDEAMIQALMQAELAQQREDAEEGVEIREIEEEFQGETLHVRQTVTADDVTDTDGWAIVDGLVVEAQPKAFLQEMVANVKRGTAETPWASTAQFRKLKARTPSSELLVHVNIESLMPMMREAAQQSPDDPPSPFGQLSPDAMISGLALDKIQGAYLSTNSTREVTSIDAGVLYQENKGLVKLLAYEPGPVKLPHFLPEGTASAGVSNFSIPKMWDGLKEVFQGINPGMAGMMTMWLQQLSTAAGFDLEQGLFGSLGDSMVSAQFFREPREPGEEPSLDDMDSLVGIAVNDRQTLEMALEGLKTMAGQGTELFEAREYLDHTIYISRQELPSDVSGEPGQQVAYALSDDYLFVSVGTTAPLELALSAGATPKRSIWNRSDVKSAMERVPRDASALFYYDVAAFFGSFVKYSVQAASMGGETEEGESADIFVDPDAAPDPSAVKRYFGLAVGSAEKESDGFYTSFHLLKP
jgi:hypothetical protein